MDYTFWMMRHAYSRHNLEKDQWKQRFGNKSYKDMSEYRVSKFSPDLIDSPTANLQQCLKAIQTLPDLSNISLILCSPLQRCLQTCKLLTQQLSPHPPVLVQPLLSSRFSAAWSIGSNAFLLVQNYPGFDFSALQGRGQSWMVNMLQTLPRFSQKDMREGDKNMQEYLLEKIEGGEGENYFQFFQRMQALKGKIKMIVSGLQNTQEKSKQILIISHSCVLSFLLGQQLNEKGKVKDKISFQHCLPQMFHGKELLGP